MVFFYIFILYYNSNNVEKNDYLIGYEKYNLAFILSTMDYLNFNIHINHILQ